jgi:hypothetical protein
MIIVGAEFFVFFFAAQIVAMMIVPQANLFSRGDGNSNSYICMRLC